MNSRIILAILACLFLAGTGQAQTNPLASDATPIIDPGVPVGGDGPFPGAGTVLATFAAYPPSTTSNYHISMAWNAPRATLWIGNEQSAVAGTVQLFEIEPSSRTVLSTYNVQDARCGPNPNQLYGQSVNGIAVLGDGNKLFMGDFNGNLSTTDDPGGILDLLTGQITDVYYFDGPNVGSTCATCPNSTGPPGVRISNFRSTTARNSTVPGANEIWISSGLTSHYFRVSLAPGCPGTWSLLSTVTTPYASTGGSGLSYDPTISSFWTTTRLSTNEVWEFKYDSATNTAVPVQNFPVTSGTGTKFGIAPNGSSGGDPTDILNPYELWSVRTTSTSGHLIFDSGHQGGGGSVDVAVGGGGSFDLTITEDEQNPNVQYLGVASLTAFDGSWIPLDAERMVPVNLDPLFFFTLATGGAPLFTNLTGTFDANRQTTISFNGHPALMNTPVNFYMSYVVLDPNPSRALLGIRGVGPEIGMFCLRETNPPKRQDYAVSASRFWVTGRGGASRGIRIMGEHNGQAGVPWTAAVTDIPPKQVPSTVNPAAGVTPATTVVQMGNNGPGQQNRGVVRLEVTFTPPNQPPRTVTMFIRKD